MKVTRRYTLRYKGTRLLLLVGCMSIASCHRDAEQKTIATKKPAATTTSSALSTFGPLAPQDQVRITGAPEAGEVTGILREAGARAKAEGRELIVYVGATWCEPCQRFHKAANRGELDTAFPNLTLI